jgi:hypothetical protein
MLSFLQSRWVVTINALDALARKAGAVGEIPTKGEGPEGARHRSRFNNAEVDLRLRRERDDLF